GDLASDRYLVADEDLLHDLLGDGGTASEVPGDRVGGGGGDSLEVDAVVFEEVLVLGGENGLDDGLGDVLVADWLGVAAVVELRQQLAARRVDPGDPGQVGEAELHVLDIGYPFVADLLEGAEGGVGAQEADQPDPGRRDHGDRQQGG